MRRCIDECDELAKESGAKIVNSCGFDSIPSDLGVFLRTSTPVITVWDTSPTPRSLFAP